jgi:hypothetical protein
MYTEVVAKAEHRINLLATRREHMQVNVPVRALEQPVLEPIRLPDVEEVTSSLQVWHVCLLGRRVRDLEDNVDNRLGA